MNRRLPARSGLWTVAALTVLAVLWTGSLTAQPSGDLAAMLVRQVYTAIRDEALRTRDRLTLLNHTMTAAQQAFVPPPGADRPELPRLPFDEGRDIEAAARYVQTVADASPQPEVIIGAALRGMIAATDDLAGAVFAPTEFTRYLREQLRCEYPGIGVQVDRVGGHMAIVDVTPAGPAARSGMRAGDGLLAVGDLPVAERSPDEVMELLHGPPGSTVVLTLRRDGAGVRQSVRRESARETPTRWNMPDSRIGYIRLLEFCVSASVDAQRAVGVLAQRGAAALVFDLRNNGGGLVDEAVSVASVFLRGGRVVIEARRREHVDLLVIPLERRFTGQVIILVNEFSASASEIVAGALQDDGVLLVGQRTFGKATVQTVSPLDGGWGLRLTTARYLTRRNRAIDGVGLRPDVTVAMELDRVQTRQDVQLTEALSLMQARLTTGGGARR